MFKLEELMGRRVLKSSLIDDESVCAFFTTRDLPLKAADREDLIEEVENNKKLLCEHFSIPYENLVIPQQTHSDNIGVITQLTAHCSQFTDTDALVTNQPNKAIALNFADCVPIIFYDPVKKVVAIAHAGWRGTVTKIGPKTVDKMVAEFGSKPKDIIALIGPSIGKCCFEVKEDVREKLLKSVDNKNSEAFSNNNVDLKLVNKLQLLSIGLEKIELSEYCTSCQNELFFSYRKEKGKTARHSAVVIVKGEQ